MMKVIKETPDYCIIEWSVATHGQPASRSKERKYLCIGGKFDDDHKSRSQLQISGPDHGYFAFNAADKMSMNARRLPYWNKQKNSMIWVHQEKLWVHKRV